MPLTPIIRLRSWPGQIQSGDSHVSIKLLIIDDDRNLTDSLKKYLEVKQFEVTVVDSGAGGIEAARQLNPEVILLDLMMPGIDGWQVCAAIRAFSRCPILIFSGVINSEMVTKALDEGADDYLIKPAPPNVIASRLQRLARLARANPSNDQP